MTVSTRRIGTLIWVLVYGGLFAICIGVALGSAGERYGPGVVVGGAVVVAAGLVLIWLRSRRPER